MKCNGTWRKLTVVVMPKIRIQFRLNLALYVPNDAFDLLTCCGPQLFRHVFPQALESLDKMELIAAKKQKRTKKDMLATVQYTFAGFFGFAVEFSRGSLCALSLSLSLLDPQKSTWALNLIPKPARDFLFTSRSYIHNRPAGL